MLPAVLCIPKPQGFFPLRCLLMFSFISFAEDLKFEKNSLGVWLSSILALQPKAEFLVLCNTWLHLAQINSSQELMTIHLHRKTKTGPQLPTTADLKQ